jgi:nitrite reductase/ring-hydroxylating ferredoxin subunit
MAAQDGRERLDVLIDSARREGLTGTAPANLYGPLHDPEQVTTPPDWQSMETQPVWRTDFPVDWPQDHYVERREFMKFMVVTSLAFTVGQFWIAAQNWVRRRRGRMEMMHVASIADVPVGGMSVFSYPTAHDPCVLVRTGDRTFVAYSQKCTHLSCAVLPQVAAGSIRCPCHDGLFDLATGRPLAGPPRRPLSRVTLQFNGDQIFATGVEERTA